MLELIGFEEIHSKKGEFVVLYTVERDFIDESRGKGRKCYSDFISADIVKGITLSDMIGEHITISYNRNQYVTAVNFE